MSDVAYLKTLLGVHPGFPKPGITFLDIFPILRDPVAFETLITHLLHHIITSNKSRPDVIVGLDARGFLLGPILAMRLGAAFVPVRKSGKLPGETSKAVYAKEYGEDVFEMQKGAIQPGQKCVVVELEGKAEISDLIATGGSASAAGQLIKSAGGQTLEYVFVIGLPFLQGEKKLDAPAYSMIQAED